MKTWADDADIAPPSRSIDRDAGEGPPRCCARRFVAADALVRYDQLPLDSLALVKERFPHLASIAPLYLCDACGETLVREHVWTREDRAEGLGLSSTAVAKARAHDAVFRA